MIVTTLEEHLHGGIFEGWLSNNAAQISMKGYCNSLMVVLPSTAPVGGGDYVDPTGDDFRLDAREQEANVVCSNFGSAVGFGHHVYALAISVQLFEHFVSQSVGKPLQLLKVGAR